MTYSYLTGFFPIGAVIAYGILFTINLLLDFINLKREEEESWAKKAICDVLIAYCSKEITKGKAVGKSGDDLFKIYDQVLALSAVHQIKYGNEIPEKYLELYLYSVREKQKELYQC